MQMGSLRISRAPNYTPANTTTADTPRDPSTKCRSRAAVTWRRLLREWFSFLFRGAFESWAGLTNGEDVDAKSIPATVACDEVFHLSDIRVCPTDTSNPYRSFYRHAEAYCEREFRKKLITSPPPPHPRSFEVITFYCCCIRVCRRETTLFQI